ncbi:MAG TPA: diaminopimelate epimerase [Thermodesulfovibrionales bacterium]|nr:diaminopimelate epimerase [Thermodesulfovibrionales bacterium]
MIFTKMHGLGNDFVLIDCRGLELPGLPKLAEKLCHRRFGIGADQLLLLRSSTVADFRMQVFNGDGSEVEMCGNGIRCLAKYIWERGLSEKRAISVETLAGVMRPEKAGGLVKVDMGEPVFEPEKIPVDIVQSSRFKVQGSEEENAALSTQNSKPIMDYPLKVEDREFKITCVSMGNPHAVIIVDNVKNFPVAYFGPRIESHPLFPRRTNVEFIEVSGPSEIVMRVWERGAGETMACGTGASAVAVACSITGLTARKVTVHLAGGDLAVEWAGDNHVYMTGPAVEVFTGEIDIDGAFHR